MRFTASALALPLLLALHFSLPSAAQTTTPPAPGTATLQIQSNLVFVPTTVQTKKGAIIYGLTANQFLVEADGVPQKVTLEPTDEVRPLALAVVIQCSRAYGFEYPKMQGLATMVDAMIGGAPASVAVMDFGTDPELITNFTTNVIRRERAIQSITPCPDDPKNAIFNAVDAANKLFERMDPKGRHVILLVSETRDHGSTIKPEQTIRELGRSNTIVDSVAYSPGRDELDEDLKHSDGASGGPIGLVLMAVQAMRKNAPKEFARMSGGDYIDFSSQNKFDNSLNGIANRVNNYYLLSFQPQFPPGFKPKDVAASNLHHITVRVPEYPDAIIRHRETYWSDTPDEPTSITTQQ